MSFESLNQLSATTIGGGSAKPRCAKVASRLSSISRAQCSLSRHGAPGPTGSGRRMAKSTGTIKRPSPTTTRSNSPSIPDNTRFCWPLHHLPTNPNCAPYLWNTESSQTQVHCQRLRRPLRLAPVAVKAFMRVQATALSGFGLLLGVSCDGGHRRLLQTVMLAIHGEKDTMSPKELDFKNFHGPHTVSLRRWPP